VPVGGDSDTRGGDHSSSWLSPGYRCDRWPHGRRVCPADEYSSSVVANHSPLTLPRLAPGRSATGW